MVAQLSKKNKCDDDDDDKTIKKYRTMRRSQTNRKILLEASETASTTFAKRDTGLSDSRESFARSKVFLEADIASP